jgi:ubiquinone/menaquinone biosynthesis C-methylase UbiE
MDADLRRSMLQYYDERAAEYEEAYVLGTGTASIPDSNIFRVEARVLAGVVARFARGRLIDLACGTAYWLPHYIQGCSSVTCFDQSERMLDECRKKIARLNVADRCSVTQGDLFDYALERDAFDCALVGFLLSHLNEEQESILFTTLYRILHSSGRFLILDSAYSAERASFNAKIERQRRRLNDGACFEVYKRYCDREDIAAWSKQYDVTINVEHFGTAFYAVSGSFSRSSHRR